MTSKSDQFAAGVVLWEALVGHRLYDALARTVCDARADLHLGRRTQGPRFETPVPHESSGLIELSDEDLQPAGIRGWIPALLRPFKK